MDDGSGLRITRSVVIPYSELRVTFSPSGGPGGQHANKTSTRAELEWNLDASGALSDRQKQRVRGQLRSRIDTRGNLRISGDEYRSQTRNRAEVEKRFVRMLSQALTPPRDRVATRPTKASKERRLEGKKRRSDIKRQRRAPDL
jgi:ribosome-associated protein